MACSTCSTPHHKVSNKYIYVYVVCSRGRTGSHEPLSGYLCLGFVYECCCSGVFIGVVCFGMFCVGFEPSVLVTIPQSISCGGKEAGKYECE